MLQIPEFGMQIDAPADCGLASQWAVTLYGPLHGRYGVGITPPQPGDDPDGGLEDQYALMAALGPVGEHGATFLNCRDPAVPFLGAIRNPHTGRLYLMVPYNHDRLDEKGLRGVIGDLVRVIGFTSPAMAAWDEVLRGGTFTEAETYQRQLGSGEGYSRQEDLTFRADGTYLRRISGHTSISGGGLSLGSVRDDRETGNWDVVEVEGQPRLRLDGHDGRRQHWSLQRTGQALRFNGRPFVRTGPP